MDSHLRPPSLFCSPTLFPHPTHNFNNRTTPEHRHQDVLNNTPFPTSLVRPPTDKIPPPPFHVFVPPPFPIPPSVPRELNPNQPLVQDASAVTTDSNNQTWLPSSSPSLPASSEHPPHQPQHLSPQQQQQQQQQDFVLFPPPNQQRHSHRSHQQAGPSRSNRQNRHCISSPASLRRLPPHQQKALIESFLQATESHRTAAASNQRQQPGQRPPVPLFSVSPAASNKNMELDIDLEPFVGFEGGATTSQFASPAQQTYNFDMSSSVTSSHISTVSPNDLLMSSDIMSNPGSSALTALTTPSGYDGSPAFTDSWENSPLFSANEAPESWPSLFPEAELVAPAPASAPSPAPALAQAAQVDQSPSTSSDDFKSVRRPTQPRKSSAANSSSGRPSSVAGVSSRRRGKPLPPITVEDPSDDKLMKRAKNTLAARKSRARKAERMDDLEKQIHDLRAENEKLQAERDQWRLLALKSGTQ